MSGPEGVITAVEDAGYLPAGRLALPALSFTGAALLVARLANPWWGILLALGLAALSAATVPAWVRGVYDARAADAGRRRHWALQHVEDGVAEPLGPEWAETTPAMQREALLATIVLFVAVAACLGWLAAGTRAVAGGVAIPLLAGMACGGYAIAVVVQARSLWSLSVDEEAARRSSVRDAAEGDARAGGPA